MKTTETTQNQTVRTSPNVIAKIKNDVKMAQANDVDKEEPAEVQADKPKKEIVKKETKPRAESNEALGERLLKEKADQDRIIKEFTAVYKSKAGVTDKKFVAARAAIYMKIAKKKAEAKAKVK